MLSLFNYRYCRLTNIRLWCKSWRRSRDFLAQGYIQYVLASYDKDVLTYSGPVYFLILNVNVTEDMMQLTKTTAEITFDPSSLGSVHPYAMPFI